MKKFITILPLFSLFLAGCVTQEDSGISNLLACPKGLTIQIHDRLFLGADSGANIVTPERFQRFLDKDVTPMFPAGLTVMRAAGQWRRSDGKLVREPSWALSLIHPPTPELDAAVAKLVEIYKQDFEQEAVLHVRSPICASLSVFQSPFRTQGEIHPVAGTAADLPRLH